MNFTCPYCNRHTTITNPNYFSSWVYIDNLQSQEGKVGIFLKAITCPNKECKNLWLSLELNAADHLNRRQEWNILKKWQLLPESEAKVLPDYIPSPISGDYYEACRIRDLSPKASATLSRRCLQGMIRDFWGISKSRLKDEVDALEDKVDSDIWGSIDAVRNVGNIGSHMEKDINIIVDVEPDEAQLLIGLIEQLIDEWYINREDRKNRTLKLKNLVAEKEAKKKETE